MSHRALCLVRDRASLSSFTSDLSDASRGSNPDSLVGALALAGVSATDALTYSAIGREQQRAIGQRGRDWR